MAGPFWAGHGSFFSYSLLTGQQSEPSIRHVDSKYRRFVKHSC